MRRSPLVGVLVSLAVITAACSSNNSGSGSGSGSSTTSGSGSSGSSTTATTAPAFTGNPIDLMVINNQGSDRSLPEVYAGADAAAAAINAAGGVQHHKVVIIPCNDQLTPNATASCARSAVANKNLLALVGSYTEFGSAMDPIINAAHLPDIGLFPQTGDDYAAKTAFPIASGAIGSVAGMATLVTDVLGSKRISVPYINVSSGSQIVQLLEGVLQTRPGASIVTKVAVPATATDMSASVQASTQNNPGGIILVIPGSQDLQFLETAKSQGVTVPIVSPGAEVSQSSIAKLGAAANGTYVTTSFPPTGGSGNAEFTAQMAKYEPSATQDDLAKNAWLSVWLFANVAKNLSTLSRASVLSALEHTTSYSTGGMTPTLDFSKTFSGFGGTLPRMFNQTVVYTKVVNGKFVATGSGFADPFAPLPSGGSGSSGSSGSSG